MSSSRRQSPFEEYFADPHLRAALQQLFQAWNDARQSRRNVWDFAVPAADLRATGLMESDLQWLIAIGYVQHAVEKTPAGVKRRVFGSMGAVAFRDRSCFVLTKEGARAARALKAKTGSAAPQLPFYHQGRQQLWLGDQLITAYERPAPVQHTILSAFQELGWPARIDDPLPRKPGQDPKERLREALKRLNRHLQPRSIRLRPDGEGKGILWQIVTR